MYFQNPVITGQIHQSAYFSLINIYDVLRKNGTYPVRWVCYPA